MRDVSTQLDRIATLISSHRFNFEDELGLQNGIDELLRNEGVIFEREFKLGQSDRVDFLLSSGPRRPIIALEVKLATSLVAITRQLFRYSKFPSVGGLILVTTRQRHNQLPSEMNGKPLRVIALEVAF